VAYLFDKKGVLIYAQEGLDVDAVMDAAIEANALDVIEEGGAVQVQTSPEAFESVKAALEAKGFVPESAELSMAPQTTLKLAGKEAQAMLKLFEALDDHEDVKQVYANFDIADEELIAAAKAS
jgi:transcriptional/translational regulatory protein YebC/TACO1